MVVQTRLASLIVGSLISLSLVPLAHAQVTGSIQGTVRDASGGILPGVTVEASSPALIERVRTVTTDGEGRYNITALQPGTYTVTFTLPGFSTFVRDGIVLTVGFSASINAELKVGTLEETVTVSGESPLVDTRSIGAASHVTTETLQTLPSGSMGGSVLLAMTPGMTGTAAIADLGGTEGYRDGMGSNANNSGFRGRQGLSYQIDGLSIQSVLAGGTFSFVPNPLLLGEMVVEAGGQAATGGSGFTINALPREGGNDFNFMLTGLYSNNAMQADNLTEKFIQRGIRRPGKVDLHWDLGGTMGGRIIRDKVWFFGTIKYQRTTRFETDNYYNLTPDTLFYTPDLNRQSTTHDLQRSHAGRITWQVSPKNKLNFLLDYQNNWVNRFPGVTQSPESKNKWNFFPSAIAQVSYTRPMSDRLLLEAAAGAAISHWDVFLQPEVGPNTIRVTELSTGYSYGRLQQPGFRVDERYNQRAALSYVTGGQTLKAGFTVEQLIADYQYGPDAGGRPGIHEVAYSFRNQIPAAITQFATPYVLRNRVNPDLGVFIQHQWTIDRMTLNTGLRYEHFSGYVLEQVAPANRFIPERSFDRVDGLPKWRDINPRAGVVYDLFGNSRTALKFSIGRFVSREGTGIANALNPIVTSVNNVTRTWNDVNQDFVPNCELTNFAGNGECGPISNQNFGRRNVTTRWSDDVLEGYGARPSFWDINTEVQQQFGQVLSATAGWTRNWHGNFRATNNLAVEPEDFDPFCVMAPAHPDLPGGGGYQICGLYDIKPAKFGQVNNLVVSASDFGEQTRVGDYFHLNLDSRFRKGALLRGGINVGRQVDDVCFVIDSPQELLFCRQQPSFIDGTQVKIQASYPLPFGTVASAMYQNLHTVPYSANFTMPNSLIAPSLGRNLAACGAAVVCNATATVPLLQPGVNFEARRNQLDLRFTKLFTLDRTMRLQANLDIYNVGNSGALLTTNSTFGPSFRNPQNTVNGRLFQVSGRLTF